MPAQDSLELIMSLLNLSVQCYPQQMENVDKLLDFSATLIHGYKQRQFVFHSSPSSFYANHLII